MKLGGSYHLHCLDRSRSGMNKNRPRQTSRLAGLTKRLVGLQGLN
jgi:hypothetical protein